MSDTIPVPSGRPGIPPRRMVQRLCIAFGVLLALDVGFWFVADFHKFHPASDGPLAERAFFAGLTASGPFAYVINGHVTDAALGVVVVGGIVGLLGAIAIMGRRFLLLRLLGYLGTAVWFMSGFSVAFLRIT